MLEIDLLGSPGVRFAGKRIEVRAPAKTWALLASILLHPQRRIARLDAACDLWPDEPHAIASGNVRRHLYRLMHNLLPREISWLHVTSRTIAWREDAEVTLDVALFESLVDDPRTAERGLRLYRGDLLPSLDEPWLEPHRARLRGRFAEAGHRELRRAARDDPHAALALAQRLRAHDPLDEIALRTVLQLRAERGERFGALRDYDDFRKIVGDELGMEPEAETRDLHRTIVAGCAMRLDASERDRRLTGFPAARNTLFGRDAERDALGESLLHRPLLTLLGIGGIGKTQLALELAACAIDLFPGGATVIDVGRTDGRDRLVSELARMMGLRRACDTDKALAAIGASLANRRRIVVFDNCEMQRDAVASVVETLLPSLGGSRLIAASRERLDVAGELVHRVRPLDRASAALLFIERVQAAETAAISHAFPADVLDELVDRLDGIPLALELAATRAARSGPDVLATCLADAIGLAPYVRGRPPRRKTMGAVLDWSHGWLDQNARRVFRRLSVFVGGWTAATACTACGDGDDAAVHAALDALVEGSLLTIDRTGVEQRYRYLEPVRAYAERRLLDADEHDVARIRHAEAICMVAETFTEERFRIREGDRLARSAADIDNMRAALTWTLRRRHGVALGRRIAAASMFFLYVAPDEGRDWLLEALATLDVGADPSIEARLQAALARQANQLLRYPEAFAAAQRAFELARSLDDETLLRSIIPRAMFAAVGVRRFDEAEAFALEGIARAQSLGNAEYEREIRHQLPNVVMLRGDYDRARTLFTDQLRSANDDDSAARIANTNNFAENEYLAGRTTQAIRLCEEAIRLSETPNDNTALPFVLVNYAMVLFGGGRHSEARTAALHAIDAANGARVEALTYLAMQTLAAVAEAEGHAAVAARLLAFIDDRLSREGFVRVGAPQRQAEELGRRLSAKLTADALARAASAVRGWHRATALRDVEVALGEA